MGFPKISGTFLGIPMIRIAIYIRVFLFWEAAI